MVSANTPEEVVEGCDFYSRYYPKTHEFRAHVFRGKVIDFIEKRARPVEGLPPPDREVRSWSNGWVFSHNLSVEESTLVPLKEACVKAVACLGLDFGTVDILAILEKTEVPRRMKSYRICEVNTAPGLESPTTIDAWVSAIKEWLHG